MKKTKHPIQTLRQFYLAAEDFGRRSWRLGAAAGFLLISPTTVSQLPLPIPVNYLDMSVGVSSLLGLGTALYVFAKSASLATTRVRADANNFTNVEVFQIPNGLAAFTSLKSLSGIFAGSAAEWALNATLTSARTLEAPDPVIVASAAFALGASYFVLEFPSSIIDMNELRHICTQSSDAKQAVNLRFSLIRRTSHQP